MADVRMAPIRLPVNVFQGQASACAAERINAPITPKTRQLLSPSRRPVIHRTDHQGRPRQKDHGNQKPGIGRAVSRKPTSAVLPTGL